MRTTKEIVEGEEYLGSPEEFFPRFAEPYEAVRCQLLKLETKQHYNETGNASFDAFFAEDVGKAIDLLPGTKTDDKPIYAGLAERHVDLIRCRPIVKPLSLYMKWEILNYFENLKLGERIFLSNYRAVAEIFETLALHDFMVFDGRFAMVHNYNDAGEILGGWRIDDTAKIQELTCIFAIIKANSVALQSVYQSQTQAMMDMGLSEDGVRE